MRTVLIILWSVVSIGAWGLVNIVGDVALFGAGIIPTFIGDAIHWLLSLVQDLGFLIVFVAWVVGVLAIFGRGRGSRRRPEDIG